MYSTQRITYEEFVNHTRKLQFLSENISQLTSEAERETAYDILNKCSSILSGNEGSYSAVILPVLPRVFPGHASEYFLMTAITDCTPSPVAFFFIAAT